MNKQTEHIAKRLGYKLIKKPFIRWYDPQGQIADEQEIISCIEALRKVVNG